MLVDCGLEDSTADEGDIQDESDKADSADEKSENRMIFGAEASVQHEHKADHEDSAEFGEVLPESHSKTSSKSQLFSVKPRNRKKRLTELVCLNYSTLCEKSQAF